MKKTVMTIMLMPLMALATTWYVDGAKGSDVYSGKSVMAAKKTIQAAITASSDGDVIMVEPGMYGKIVSDNKRIVIRSTRGVESTYIDGGNVGRCAELGAYKDRREVGGIDTNTTVVGFTIQHGKYAGGGAALGGRYVCCVFRDNVAEGYNMGGAVQCALLENCLLADNSASNGGGAAVSILKNCTLVNNTAHHSGGGAYDSDLYNCVVYGNDGGAFHDGFNVCITENMYTDDPHFVDSDGGNYRLAADSPCIDAGDNSYVVGDTDLDGNVRIVNGTVDIGCYEYVGGDPIVYRMVTFDGNGGVVSADSRSVKNGAAVGELPVATRSGYDFAGWFTAAVGGVQVSASTVVAADVTWYAHWTPIRYDIVYSGLRDASNPNPTKYTVEDAVTFSALPDVAGYRFTGWSPSSIDRGSTGNKTVTAQYAAVPYEISYVDTKGAANPNPATYTIEDAVTFAALPDVDGWKFLGWSSAGISKGNVGIVTVVANWEKVAPSIIPPVDKPMDAGIANNYDGVIVDADGLPLGYITIKAGKASNAGVSKVTATIQMVGEAKKVTIKGDVDVAAATLTASAADGRVLDLLFSRDTIFGTFDGYAVEGVRNLLSSGAKGADDAKAKAEAAVNRLKGGYVMAYGDESGYNGLSVTVMAKGKVKVSGKLANGVSVATSSQLIVGENYSCIPVIYTKNGTALAFSIYFANDGTEAMVFGYYDAVISPVGGLTAGSSFGLESGIYDLFDGYALLDEFLPWGVSVEPNGTKWVIADGAKAGKVKIVDGTAVDTNESANPSGLKLTFTAKTGVFKGSFKAYALDANDKLKTFTATVSGVVVNGVGYGAATIKGRGSCAVGIAR